MHVSMHVENESGKNFLKLTFSICESYGRKVPSFTQSQEIVTFPFPYIL